MTGAEAESRTVEKGLSEQSILQLFLMARSPGNQSKALPGRVKMKRKGVYGKLGKFEEKQTAYLGS